MSADALPFVLRWKYALSDDVRLSHTTLVVAWGLTRYLSRDGWNGHPGHARLARDTHLKERAVRAALELLVDLGWLVVTRKHAPGIAKTYRATIPTIPPEHRVPYFDATPQHRHPGATVEEGKEGDNTGTTMPVSGATPVFDDIDTGTTVPHTIQDHPIEPTTRARFAERGEEAHFGEVNTGPLPPSASGGGNGAGGAEPQGNLKATHDATREPLTSSTPSASGAGGAPPLGVSAPFPAPAAARPNPAAMAAGIGALAAELKARSA